MSEQRMHQLECTFEHPTKSILDSLYHEIEVWCKRHGVKYDEVDNQKEVD